MLTYYGKISAARVIASRQSNEIMQIAAHGTRLAKLAKVYKEGGAIAAAFKTFDELLSTRITKLVQNL